MPLGFPALEALQTASLDQVVAEKTESKCGLVVAEVGSGYLPNHT